MADLSKLAHPDFMESMRENIDQETARALRDRLLDAEQMWRYFARRDEMNAEIHLADGEQANVRYSPITIAAERVAGYLSKLYYGEPVSYRTAILPKE